MRLKRLDIKGFKSFANETVVHFNENVIGIVGPNGAGKSNIVDAIRWVLGEQKSRELRLDKMNSVIFNGAKKRKPAPMAQVSLTFENTRNLLPTEYHQITITRILYQSGDSEYRLNDVPCRLKDITSLFLDTGIGSNSYAIIALGMVDDLLADKENARRSMLEQAAGISKFKARKHETLQKLESTSADLDRVEDLLFEISGNLSTLEKQAKRTQRYFEMKEEYREASVNLAILKTGDLKRKYKDLESVISREEDQIRSLQIQLNTQEAELEQLRAAHAVSEQTLSERQRGLNSLVGRIRGMENDKQLAQQQSVFAKQNQERANQIIANSDSQTRRLLTEIGNYESQVVEERAVEVKLEMAFMEAGEQLNAVRGSHSSLKSDLDQFLQQSQQLERQLFDLDKQKAVNQNQMDNAQRELESQAEVLNLRKSESDQVLALIAELEAKVQAQQAEIAQLEKKEAERKQKLADAEKLLEETQAALSVKNREADAKKNELKLTKSMVENLEGFPESIRFLSNAKNWPRNAQLLSDMVYCKPEYRSAIEFYLEPWLNYYVVDTLAEAQEAVGLLRNSQKGKASFFVLEQLPGYTPSKVILPNAILGTDLIEVEPKLQNLMAYLLGNVFVVPDEMNTSYVEQHPELSFVSITGGFSHNRFKLSGGSVGLFEGKKIGRKKNIEILERDTAALDLAISTLQQQHQQQRQHIQSLREADQQQLLRRAQQELQLQQQNQMVAQTRLENFNLQQKESTDKTLGANALMQQLNANNVELTQQAEEIRKQLEDLQNLMTGADSSYRNVADELAVLNSRYNEFNVNYIRQQNKVAAIQRELSFRRKQVEQIEDEVGQAQKTKSAHTDEIEMIANELAAFEKQLEAWYAERKVVEKDLGQAEQTYYGGRNRLGELEDSIRRTNRTLADRQVGLNKQKEEFNSHKLELTAISERLNVEFGLSIDEVLSREVAPGLNKGELQSTVDSLKRKLDGYGEINPMAVETYNEMKIRYDTIAAQRDDINEARTSLEQTMREIEETATLQFMEAFTSIRANFQEVFRHLFTEDDTCDLILINPDSPLDSPINIIAKPKGKKPQSISLLSGGEKTLTATALLFALYLHKPAPFCIFDEVDAPLDDVNIEKFNRIIKRFSADSQFIIVTHNKLTMAAVDVIYGVHMPEPGVSAVTAVDFRELEHEAAFSTLK